jgi:hypothetical protein
MYLHPEMLSALATERQRELVADGQRSHLLSAARRLRRSRRSRASQPAAELAPAGRTADTLGACGPSVVPVR